MFRHDHHRHLSGLYGTPIRAKAKLTTATSIRKYLRVCPEEPQSIVWLHEGTELQYDVESNTKWKID